MGCRNGEDDTTLEMTVTTSGDELLLATLCTVGLPVEVHVKDGSIYSGVFHTASLDDGYAIVLKKARMIENGRFSNLEVGTLVVVDTLIVPSNDLVQVIVKDLLLPMEGDFDIGDRLREGIEAVDSPSTSGNIDGNQENKSIKFSGEADMYETHLVKKIKKSLDNNHNDLGGKDGCLCREEVVEQSHRPEVSVPEGQVRDRDAHAEAYSCSHIEMDSSTNTVLYEAHHSSCCSKKSINGDKSSNSPVCPSTRPSSSVSSDSNSTCSNLTTSPNLQSSERSPFYNTCTKEFKLNPEAKVFLPSFARAKSASAVIPTAVHASYVSSIPPAMPVAAAQSCFEISSCPTYTPLPAKFVQYSPLSAGQTGINTQYPQPISGQVNARQQPARFIGQYHPTIQTGTAYMHQNTQPVMVGRTGQLVYVHPISQDPMQGTVVLSQGFPVLTPCQVNMPKLQGTHAQSLQFCMTPPLVTATPAQHFAIPNSIPFSSPAPAIRPITVTGGNGFFGSKFQ